MSAPVDEIWNSAQGMMAFEHRATQYRFFRDQALALVNRQRRTPTAHGKELIIRQLDNMMHQYAMALCVARRVEKFLGERWWMIAHFDKQHKQHIVLQKILAWSSDPTSTVHRLP